ncbi:MAG: radical SAM family heme chaperone HemW [Pseudomonadota bacterium]
MASLYLHIPFCVKKCHYCSFDSCAEGGAIFAQYVAALKKELFELAHKRNERPLKSLFIGGGTPSVLPSFMLVELLDHCRELFPPAQQAEISIEANPGTVDESSLSALMGAGVNRLSLGVQSFNDQELQVLGRIHNGLVACDAVSVAKRTGFTNINIDLMYGLPGQTVASWHSSLEQAITLYPQHLSLYQLTVEEGTPFQQAVAGGGLILPEEEEVLQMDYVSASQCGAAGFQQYEISNFAIPGYECLHNINYWQNGEYLACGASAVSCVAGVRKKRIPDPWEYIRRMNTGLSLYIESECLSTEASFRESVIMGLRMTKGVSLEQLNARYQIDLVAYYGSILEKLIDLKLIELTTTSLSLTAKGRPFANWIMAELV